MASSPARRIQIGDYSEHLHHASLAVLDLLPVAVIMLDENGCATWTNVAAHRLLKRGDGIVLNGGNRLRGATSDRTAEIYALVQAARDDLTGRQRHLALPRETHRRALHISAICTDIPGARGLRVALLISDPEFPDPLCKRALRSFYALTATEAEVGRRLATGETPEEIARSLHVGIETVRSHLKQLYRKTGTRRQAELVQVLVSGLAALQV